MKKIFLIAFIAILIASPVYAAQKFSAFTGMWSMGPDDQGSATSFALDSNFIFGTSGDSAGFVFNSPVNQSSGALTVYIYCTAQTGTTNETSAKVYASATGANDDDRPDAGSSPLATSATVDASGCGTAQWLTYSFTGLSLKSGDAYWLVVTNDEADPVTNSFSIQTRGALDMPTVPTLVGFFRIFTSTNGFTADPTFSTASTFPGVIKYNDGTLGGNPFVVEAASHANNTESRGFRVNFDEDIEINGALWNTISDPDLLSLEVYQGSTMVTRTVVDSYTKNNVIAFATTTLTLSGGLDYDFIMAYSGNAANGQVFNMGNNPPTDVQNVNTNYTYVNGTTGSLTEFATSTFRSLLMFNTNPAITGGGGTDILGNVIQ